MRGERLGWRVLSVVGQGLGTAALMVAGLTMAGLLMVSNAIWGIDDDGYGE